TITRDIAVRGAEPPRLQPTEGSLWPLRNTWNRETENLYSAWIEKLFDAPLDATLSWKALHEVLRDRSRNVLFNHLGLREDSMGMIVRPDCADLPYFLRAYFAFRRGLPCGYRRCTGGGGGGGPKCQGWWNTKNLEPPPAPEPPPEQQIASPAGVVEMFRPAAVAQPVAPPVSRLASLKRLGPAAGVGSYFRSVAAPGAPFSNRRNAAARRDNPD